MRCGWSSTPGRTWPREVIGFKCLLISQRFAAEIGKPNPQAALYITTHFTPVLRRIALGAARQGNPRPSGSPPTAPRPSALIVSPVAPSINTRVGMPSTSNRVESAALRLSPGGRLATASSRNRLDDLRKV